MVITMNRMTPFFSLLLLACGPVSHSQDPAPPHAQQGVIVLPNVHGRIDHLAVDPTHHRAFIAALGNNSVEVVDLKARKHIASITGIEEPQGIVFIPEDGSVLVSSGADGSCNFYSTDSLQLKRSIKLDGDADNIRYSPSMGRIFIGHGDGGIAVIDARTFKVIADIPVGGHPESLQLDEANDRLFVNVPDEQEVCSVSLSTMKVMDRWKLEDARANFPMTLDAANRHLIIGCRSPARILVMSYSGELVQQVDGPEDMDDLFYNVTNTTLHAIAGAGLVVSYLQDKNGSWREEQRTTTRHGARTGYLTSDGQDLLVAAPAREGEGAALLVIKTNSQH